MNPNEPLDLSDPIVLEALKKVDVAKAPPAKPKAETIKERQKGSSITIKLSAEELSIAQRMAADAYCDDWKDYMVAEFRTKVLQSKIGSPRIGRPSWANPVTSPSTNSFK